MSEQNAEMVRSSYDACVRGDMETALAAIDPEIEIYGHDILDAGRASFDACFAVVFTIRADRIVRVREHATPAEALKAVGLEQ